MVKKALVVVNFGSSVPSARVCLDNVAKVISEKNPGRDLFSCYTSNIIRKKLIAQGEKMPSLDELLAELEANGYTDVMVCSTHIIPGQEYEKLCGMVEGYLNRFEQITISKPLINDAESIQEVARVLADIYSVDDDCALILMGHGTEHVSNFIYPALQTAFRTNGVKNAYVATVEGWPELDDVIRQLKQKDTEKVLLAPMLLVAGDHVMNDMMGPEDDSWKNILESEGFDVECCGKGLSEYPELVELYTA